MDQSAQSDFMTDGERESGGMLHEKNARAMASSVDPNAKVSSQADQYAGSDRKTIIAANPPPHDEPGDEPEGGTVDNDFETSEG